MHPARWPLRLLGLIYVLAAAAVFFFPEQILYVVSAGPRTPDAVERFWLVYVTGALVALAALSFFTAENPGVRGYALTHLLAKAAGAAGFLHLFLNQERHFAFGAGFAIETLLAAVVAWTFVRSFKT